MLEVYKILSHTNDQSVSDILTLHDEMVQNRPTRGHSRKLYKKKVKLDVKKFSF